MPSAADASDEDRITDKLGDLFATVKGHTTPPSPPGAAPGARPSAAAASAAASRPAELLVEAPTPSGTVVQPSVDVVRLIKYLDAQLELTRREARDDAGRVLGALQSLDKRITKLEARSGASAATAADLDQFRTELFDWLEGYSGWEAKELQRIWSLTNGVFQVLDAELEGRLGVIPGTVPPRSSR